MYVQSLVRTLYPFNIYIMSENNQMGLQFPSKMQKLKKTGIMVGATALTLLVIYSIVAVSPQPKDTVAEIGDKITAVNVEIRDLKQKQEAAAKALEEVEKSLHTKREAKATLETQLVEAQNAGIDEEFQNTEYRVFNPLLPEAQAEEPQVEEEAQEVGK